MFHKTIKFFKLAKLRRKQQPKRNLLRLLPFLLIELVFVIELAFQNFFLQKRIWSQILISTLLLVFWFLLSIFIFNDLTSFA